MGSDARTLAQAINVPEFLVSRFGLVLRAAGSGFTACCPLPGHNDKNPSFVVWPGGKWRCFGCSSGGDVFDLLQRIEGIGFSEAMAQVAAFGGISPDERRPPRRRRKIHTIHVRQDPDFSTTARLRATETTDEELRGHADRIGVTLVALRRLGAFSSRRHPRAVCFPLSRPSGVVVGVRMRAPNGRKWSARGTAGDALFLPSSGIQDGTLFAVEGPTDTAALLDLGVAAVGRPNCSLGGRDLRHLARGRDVVVVADRDKPGQDGAHSIARQILDTSSRVRIWTPPAKDVRAWVLTGATSADLEHELASAHEVSIEVSIS